MSRVFVGTSGFSYASWRGRFYPPGLPSHDFLKFYARHFPAVELNVTFYRWPRAQTLERWRAQVGEDFRFAVKAHRTITHHKRLANCGPELVRLRELCHRLRASVVLLQLPPSFAFDASRLAEFAQSLPSGLPSLAWEARHKSFASPEVWEFFRACGWSLVVADSGGRFPGFQVVTALPLYLRFHGPRELYASPYSQEQLATYARWALQVLPEQGEAYAFFNNDVGAYAVDNAGEFAALLETPLLAEGRDHK